MARKRDKKRVLALKLRRAIQGRLDDWIKRSPYGNAYHLVQALGLTHSAVTGWLNSVEPVTPDTPSLYKLSEELGISIDWLLFEEGPDLRGAVRTTGEFVTDLRTQLIAALRQRALFSEDELDDFLPAAAAETLWESIVSHFGWLLLDQGREEHRADYFKWLVRQRASGTKPAVRPFYQVERPRRL